jgi:hypothetical protein
MKLILLTLTLLLQAPAPPRPGGTVTGTVIAAGTSEPVADAEVAIATASAAFETTTDANGRFSLADIPVGVHTILIRADGYFAAPAIPSAGAPTRAEVPVTIAQGALSVPLSPVTMIRGAIITGKVVDPEGKPLPFAAVQALRPGPAAQLQTVAVRMTDDQGDYRLFWVPPGEYLIGVAPRAPAPANLTVPGPRPPMTRTLFPNTTDVAQASKVAVKSGDEIRGIDISARLDVSATPLAPPPPPPPPSPGVKVSGQITNGLMPATGTGVLMLGSRKGEQPRQVGSVALNAATVPFELPSVPPGDYDLFVRMPDNRGSVGAGGASNAWGRATLEVRDRNVEGVRMTIHPSLSVPGIVKIDGKPAPAGIPKIVLSPMGSAGLIPNYRGILDRGQTPGEGGKFAIPGAAEGDYEVLVQGLPDTAYVSDIRQGDTSIMITGVQVRETEPAAFEVLLATDGGTVEGIASGSDTKPAGGAMVVLVPEDRQLLKLALKSGNAGPEGRYSIRGVRPGEYKLFAGPPGQLPPPEALSEMLSKFESKAVKVTVKAATATKADATLVTD